jgi:cytochrome c oxidase subunit 2
VIATATVSSWLPQAASTQSQGVDPAFYGVYVVGAFAVILVAGLAMTFVRQFPRKGENERGHADARPNVKLQAAWVLAALGIAIYAFTAGLPGFLDANAAPWMSYRVLVTASQDGYKFTYPNGHIADTLHVAISRPVRLDATTADVIHTLQAPALRLNEPVLPGRTAQAWFNATLPGTYELRSAVYGGDRYQDMRTAVVAHTPADFDAWMIRVSDVFAGRTMEQAGELLYVTKGCKTCHSIDGSKLVGPSFKNVYGHQFDTREGVKVTADDAYIKESILKPNVSVILGFEPVMTPFEGKITDKEIAGLTAYLRTLSDLGGKPAGADTTAAKATDKPAGKEVAVAAPAAPATPAAPHGGK